MSSTWARIMPPMDGYGLSISYGQSYTEQLNEIKEFEKLKASYGLKDFHILMDGSEYTFMTDEEMSWFKKYSVSFIEMNNKNHFYMMLRGLKKSSSVSLILGSTGNSHKTIESLLKEHHIIKISGVE